MQIQLGFVNFITNLVRQSIYFTNCKPCQVYSKYARQVSYQKMTSLNATNGEITVSEDFLMLEVHLLTKITLSQRNISLEKSAMIFELHVLFS